MEIDSTNSTQVSFLDGSQNPSKKKHQKKSSLIFSTNRLFSTQFNHESEDENYLNISPNNSDTKKKYSAIQFPDIIEIIGPSPHEETKDQIDPKVQLKRNLINVALLILTVIANSSIGPFLIHYSVPPLLKSSWRQLSTFVFLLPFIITELFRETKVGFTSISQLFSKLTMEKLLLASFCNIFWTTTFVYSLNYTSVVHAYFFNNCQIVIIVLIKKFKGFFLEKYESLGALLYIVGLLIILYDEHFQSHKFVHLQSISTAERIIKGDLLALLGSFSSAYILVENSEHEHDYPPYFGIGFITFVGSIFLMVFSLIFEGSKFDLSPENGLLGLLSDQWLATSILFGICCSIGCFVIFMHVSRLFSSYALTISLGFEPYIGGFLAFVVGAQSLPSLLVIGGGVIIIIGVNMITMEEKINYEEGKMFLDSVHMPNPPEIEMFSK